MRAVGGGSDRASSFCGRNLWRVLGVCHTEEGAKMQGSVKSPVTVTFARYEGDRLVGRETVAHDIIKIGKDPRSHLRIDDERAARMHAVIEVGGPDQVTLIDLGNDPGTQVNGQRVNKCKLQPGDSVQIAGTRLVFESATTATAAAPNTSLFAGVNPFAAGVN